MIYYWLEKNLSVNMIAIIGQTRWERSYHGNCRKW